MVNQVHVVGEGYGKTNLLHAWFSCLLQVFLVNFSWCLQVYIWDFFSCRIILGNCFFLIFLEQCLSVVCSIEDVLPTTYWQHGIFNCSLIGRAIISGEYQWITDDIPFSLSQISDADNLGLCQVHIYFHVFPWLGSFQTVVFMMHFNSLYYQCPHMWELEKSSGKKKLWTSRKDNHFPQRFCMLITPWHHMHGCWAKEHLDL